MAHGLVTTMGTVSHTGVGGLTTGGGFGRLARKFGLALDNLTGVDVVTADGAFHHASAEENPDLFWGIRGGGGNFGVVTSFEFQLHPMDRQVIAGRLLFPFERAGDVLRFYADYTPGAPEDLQLDFGVSKPPGGGPGGVSLQVCYAGPASEADRALAPLGKLGAPLKDDVKAIDYVALQRAGDVSDPRAMGLYVKSGFTKEINQALIAKILDGFEPHPGRLTSLFTQQSGGAINRVPVASTSFAHRYAQHNLLTAVAWKNGDDGTAHMKWARQYWSTIEPLTSGFYTNEIADESKEVVDANYRENYERLVAIKNRYDPGNLFRLNANVKPTV